jgi:hypothetical protein
VLRLGLGGPLPPTAAATFPSGNGFMSRYGLGSSSAGLIRDRSVAAHHLPALPASQGHDDLPGEASIECHGCAVVPEIMEVEVTETRRLGGLPKQVTNVHAAIELVVGVREDPFTDVALELPLEQLPSRLAQHDGPGPSLRTWEPDHSLIEIDMLAPKTPDLAQAYSGPASRSPGTGNCIISRTKISGDASTRPLAGMLDPPPCDASTLGAHLRRMSPSIATLSPGVAFPRMSPGGVGSVATGRSGLPWCVFAANPSAGIAVGQFTALRVPRLGSRDP